MKKLSKDYIESCSQAFEAFLYETYKLINRLYETYKQWKPAQTNIHIYCSK